MTFTDVANKTIITGNFSDDDQKAAFEKEVFDALQTLYEGSETARVMLENWTSLLDQTITIEFVPGVAQIDPSTNHVQIDPAYANSLLYIDNSGTAREETVERVLAHELVHALTGKLDDGIGTRWPYNGKIPTDYRGATVIEANKIYSELGLLEENSYIGQDNGSFLEADKNYTYGTEINRSVLISVARDPVTKEPATNWDSTDAGDSKDLLIGDNEKNELHGGAGDDFLYGMGSVALGAMDRKREQRLEEA